MKYVVVESTPECTPGVHGPYSLDEAKGVLAKLVNEYNKSESDDDGLMEIVSEGESAGLAAVQEDYRIEICPLTF